MGKQSSSRGNPASVPPGVSFGVPDPGESAKPIRWLALALGLLALIAYSNSFTAGLVLDNGPIIGDGPRLR